MTEFSSPPSINEEIKRLRLSMSGASAGDKLEIGKQILALRMKGRSVSGALDKMHEKMHEAAEKSEGRWDLEKD